MMGKAGDRRVEAANRAQVEWRTFDLDSLIAEDHEARLIWAALERLDTTRFYELVAARVNGPGRPAIDPLILLCLWVYATSQGVGSARQVDRLCESDNANAPDPQARDGQSAKSLDGRTATNLRPLPWRFQPTLRIASPNGQKVSPRLSV